MVVRIHNILVKFSQRIYRGYDIYIYIYIYICMCECVCVCVCLKTRNRCSAETPMLVLKRVSGRVDIPVLQYSYTSFGQHRLRVFVK